MRPCDVRMQIEREHDWLVRTQHLARDLQDGAFYVILSGSGLCSMHGEQQRFGLRPPQMMFEGFQSCSYPARSSRFAVIAQAAHTGTIAAPAFFKTSMKPPISVSLPSWRVNVCWPNTGEKSS